MYKIYPNNKKILKIHRYHFSQTLNFGRGSSIRQPVTDANDTIIYTTNAQGIFLFTLKPQKTKEETHINNTAPSTVYIYLYWLLEL